MLVPLSALVLVLPISQGQAPLQAGRNHLLPLDGVARIEFAAPNVPALIKEDADRRSEGLPPRFALPNDVRVTPETSGTWENLDPEHLLWRLRVVSNGVLSLNLGFTRFRLPEGASLHLYSADRVHLVQPFTAADNEAHGELWTPVILTDDLVIELVVPAALLGEVELELGRVNQGYRPFGAPPGNERSGSCNVDVVCPEGIPWELEIPSVGVISTGGSTFCTGFLVTNVREDLKPYFMTANHCGITAGNAPSLVVYWNYENSTCRIPGSPSSGNPGDGSLAQFNTGSFFRAASSPSDFTLVELDDVVNPAFDVSYAGWDATGADAAQAIAIHHPNTDEKRISFENQPTTTTTYLSNTVPGDGTHVRVEDWDLGTTEPGSSGSPLFNQAHRVIGQLHGGFASCTSQTSDWYGKFSVSWTGGGTNATRLRNWLDPDNTGTLVTDTVSLDTLCSSAGTIELDAGRYACLDTAEAEVVDCDLNLNGNAAETVLVTVFSNVDPTGESVLLTETGPSTSRFRGTVGLTTGALPGQVTVVAGGTLSARYIDASNGGGGFNVPVLDTAQIDCTGPAVLSVVVTDVGPTGAEVTVLTDEASNVAVRFGTSCAGPLTTRTSEGLATSSVVTLTGLLPATAYFFEVRATDEAGNETLSDNGGLCFGFTTDDVPLFFTEEFLGDHDLDGVVLSFRTSGGPDGYELCRRSASGFLTSPTGGTNLALGDDASLLVNLTGGKQVEVYGTKYSSFYVNSNGNLSFGSGDSDYTPTLAEHFARRRIAALWDDLNPSAGGSVSWKQLADRVAVTFQNVPEYSTSNQNSFQIELFFAGPIRITTLGVASTGSLVGLSRGNGLDPSFVELDLSAAASCEGAPVARPAATPTVTRDL